MYTAALVAGLAFIAFEAVALVSGLAFIAELARGLARSYALLQFFDFKFDLVLHSVSPPFYFRVGAARCGRNPRAEAVHLPEYEPDGGSLNSGRWNGPAVGCVRPAGGKMVNMPARSWRRFERGFSQRLLAS
jgi:hypothetical protein